MQIINCYANMQDLVTNITCIANINNSIENPTDLNKIFLSLSLLCLNIFDDERAKNLLKLNRPSSFF